VDFNEILRVVIATGLRLAIGIGFLLLAYRVGATAIHRFVPQLIRAQAEHLPSEMTSTEELGKRIATIEDLLTRLLRLTVLALLVTLVLAILDLWTVIVAIVIVVVAVLFASQEVVLDYVMGFLILVEGPFFKGDWIKVQSNVVVEGTVDEIGLRRTLLRDAMGSVHAVSNGFIRLSSNLTRLFSVATVEVQVLHARDLERAIETATRVALAMRNDPEWSDRFAPDAPTDVWVTGLTVDGAILRLQQRVPTGTHFPFASELRRRLAGEYVAASIGTGRWDTPLPIANEQLDHLPSRSVELASPANDGAGKPGR
jgi:small-conductance mechanosensitive channel